VVDDAAGETCQALGCGVTRSKRRTIKWMRKAAENGVASACLRLANAMYTGMPGAREVGHVGEAAGVAAPAGVMQGHDVPPHVLTSVMHWLRKGCTLDVEGVHGNGNPLFLLDGLRKDALEGAMYCYNETCQVLGQLKDFKICPQCKSARYCGAACQKKDWTTGGHRETCGKFAPDIPNV